jgi:hypothetical protein
MPSFYVDDIDIEVSEFWDSCSEREKQKLLELLRNDGIVIMEDETENLSPRELEFFDKLEKLKTCYYQLSNDEIRVIESIVRKYI